MFVYPVLKNLEWRR